MLILNGIHYGDSWSAYKDVVSSFTSEVVFWTMEKFAQNISDV